MNSQNLKASVSFVGDGTTNKFYFGFDYINKQFVKVQIGNEGQSLTYPSDYTVDDRSVVLKDTPAVGVAIRVYRETSSDRIVEWADGAFIKASQMTLENLQQLHLIEEAQDYPILNSLSTYPDGVNFNALGSRVINVSDPKDPQDAVTKHYMESVQNGFVAANTILVQEATKQASAAKTSQEVAKTSETNAKTSETNSELSHQNAKKWAEATESPDGEADTDSTTGKTQSSKEWALYSKTKAQESATYATNAKISETNARTSEINAKTSETKAATSVANAKTSETNAKTSETNAKSSETNASNSEMSALAYEINARTSATDAANSAKQAAESAGVFQDFKGATADTDGNGGKVPKPLAGQQEKFLKADGTWGDCVTPITLWEGMHAYPRNYVPSDVSNVGWNKLGFCSIYYDALVVNNQPSQYGQLINIPATKDGIESAQLWIEQPSGLISFRGGNALASLNDTQFKTVATTDDVNAREKVNSQGSNWIRYESGLQLCWIDTISSQAWWTFPVAFSSPPIIQFTERTGHWSWTSDITTTACKHSSDGTGNGFAIGRWK